MPAKYWVFRLTKAYRAPSAVRPVELPPFAIQRIAQAKGASEYIAFFASPTEVVRLAGQQVPQRVLAVALRLAEGGSAYCDEEGNEV
jgi:hypothetical protein